MNLRSKIASAFLIVFLASCSNNDPPSDSDLLQSLGVGAEPKTLPAGLLRSTTSKELVANGSFSDAAGPSSTGWRLSSLTRSDVGKDNQFLSGIPTDVPASPFGSTTVARLCGYPTSVITQTSAGLVTTASNCNDMLITTDDKPIVIPKGSTSITLSVTAFARYACAGDLSAGGGHGAFVVGFSPLDGLGKLDPPSLQAKEVNLPAGSWKELSLTFSTIPGIADGDRRFKMIMNFQTSKACKSPQDQDTYVLVNNVSVRAN